jgi:hypothetical protein
MFAHSASLPLCRPSMAARKSNAYSRSLLELHDLTECVTKKGISTAPGALSSRKLRAHCVSDKVLENKTIWGLPSQSLVLAVFRVS